MLSTTKVPYASYVNKITFIPNRLKKKKLETVSAGDFICEGTVLFSISSIISYLMIFVSILAKFV